MSQDPSSSSALQLCLDYFLLLYVRLFHTASEVSVWAPVGFVQGTEVML